MTLGAELRAIVDRLQDLNIPPGHMVGDAEGERRVLLDARSGRLLAASALRCARTGLRLLDEGDAAGAAEMRDAALGMLAIAQRAGFDRTRPPIYGRPPSDRDATLARYVDAKRAATRATIDNAIAAVLAERPDLARRFMTNNPDSLRTAYKRGRKA